MCGVTGVINVEHAAIINRIMLHALQNRGRDGCGICVYDSSMSHFESKKFAGTVASNFTSKVLEEMPGEEGIGHTRYATVRNSSGKENLQPLHFHVGQVPFAIVHNGNFTNADTLEKDELKGTPFNAVSDTERFFRLILREHRSETSLGRSIAYALSKMLG